MESLDSFGAWLQQRRAALRLTRVELADCVGCSVSALRKIEADERRPSRQLAGLLAGCLAILPEKQPLFVDAARGLKPVSLLGAPELLTKDQTPPVSHPEGPTDKQSARPAWNLPSSTQPIVGREVELATLAQLLDDPACRLLTLVGPGGIGKTKLGLQAAENARKQFGDGVFFISLVGTSSPEFIVPAITQGLHLNLAGPVDPHTQLINYLGNKKLLLLLDNFEHLLEGVDLLVEMLASAPGLMLLVTSRERLDLQVEWVFEVQGLPVPAGERVEEPESYSAVALFVQRARRARQTFALTAPNKPHVVRICQLVEGMPLAIELAAAWVPTLSCQEIAAEIQHGLNILTTRLRDVPERQRSLLAVFDQSWELLTEDEQRTLRQLSIFRGGFQREAAQAVAGATLPLLSGLASKSVLRRTAAGRYGLHELMRQYVAGRLGEVLGEEAAARERHSIYYTDYMAGLERDLKGFRQMETLAAMDADIDNIRSAWRWAVRRGDLAAIRRPVRAFWYFYDIRGWFQEAQAAFGWAAEELERSLAGQDNADSTVAVLTAYIRAQQGWFCLRGGQFEEAERLLESGLEVLHAANAYVELVDALQHGGALDRLLGQYERSRARFEEMLEYAEQTDDPWNATIAEGNIGLAGQAMGDYEQASAHMRATVASFRALGDSRMLGVALHFLGGTSCLLGSYDLAQTYLRESLALSRSIGDRWIESMTLRELGNLAQELGNYAEAASLFYESLALAREIAESWSTLQALNCVGTAKLVVGELAEAHAAFLEGLDMAWSIQSIPDVLAALDGLAQWSVREGSVETRLPEVLAMISAVLDHPAAAQKVKDDAQRLLIELETSLGPERFKTAQVEAQTLSLETVVQKVLSTKITGSWGPTAARNQSINR